MSDGLVYAVAFLAAFVILAYVVARSTRQLIREHARERQLMLNQILNLAGKPWLPPPAAEPQPEVETVFAPLVDPSQLPDDDPDLY